MRLVVLAFASAAVLTACSPGEQAPQQGDAETPADPPPAGNPPAAPQPVSTPPAGTPPTRSTAGDECDAADKQAWVGQPRRSIPAAPAGQTWRIYETGQPVTQDLRPDRLNVEIDPTTQNVVRVTCG